MIDKKAFINALMDSAAKPCQTREDAEAAVGAITTTIIRALENRDTVHMDGLGTFAYDPQELIKFVPDRQFEKDFESARGSGAKSL